MTPEDSTVKKAADTYARLNKERLAKDIVNTNIYPKEGQPRVVFMAGSPGAGKTEVSKIFVKSAELNTVSGAHILRIDPDDFRALLPGYQGNNSWLFQSAVSTILSRVLDHAFRRRVSFLLDGTLSSLAVAENNIKRALNRNCLVQILYVYQHPVNAWSFVQDRELVEGRNIPLDIFIEQFISARNNVISIKKRFGDQITVDVLIQKNNDDSLSLPWVDVTADQLDQAIPETYDKDRLYQILHKGDYDAVQT